MIGKLNGTVAHKAVDHVLVDVGGIGFTVFCSERTLAALPREGGKVVLFTDLHVREDLLQLFGFRSLREREFYRMLISVQGVGAKAALSVLSALGVDGGVRAATLGDWQSIKSAHGIGPKIAQRIANELKERAALIMAMGEEIASASSDPVEAEPETVQEAPAEGDSGNVAQIRADALSALLNLGYSQSEAALAVAAVSLENADLDSKSLIREALKRLAPG